MYILFIAIKCIGCLSIQVPELWTAVAYPSLKPLASWMIDYHRRMNMMKTWILTGEPKTFWLPGFYFPQVMCNLNLVESFIKLWNNQNDNN
jgi:hypothetical protein